MKIPARLNDLPLLRALTGTEEAALRKHTGAGNKTVRFYDDQRRLQTWTCVRRNDIPPQFCQLAEPSMANSPVPPPSHSLIVPDLDLSDESPTPEPTSYELVTLERGEPVTTTLAIAQGTGVQHKNVMALVRAHINELKGFGGVAFETRPFETPGGPQNRAIALLTEPQATVLLTFMSNSDIVVKFKVRLVETFYAMKRQLAAPTANPIVAMTRLDLLKLAVELEEDKLALTQQIKARDVEINTLGCTVQTQAEEIVVLKPKGRFHDQVHDTTGLLDMGSVAQQLGTGRRRLFAWLRAKGVIQPKTNRPYQKYIDNGAFEVKTVLITDGDGVEHPRTKLCLTGKGFTWLQRNWDKYHPQTPTI